MRIQHRENILIAFNFVHLFYEECSQSRLKNDRI